MPEIETQTIRILIVDDHELFREGLAALFRAETGLEIVGKCPSAKHALAFLESRGADVILLDFDLGAESAVEFARQAKAGGFAGSILVVTAGVSDYEALELVQAGVAGILHKHSALSALCAAIRQVASGGVCLDPSYLKPLFRTIDKTRYGDGPQLNERDKTVLRHIFQGLTNKEIGGHLQLSEGAVKACLQQLFRKLGVRTRAQLVKVALERYRDQL
ncbi:MAG TPA: response regulator transcription factor [Bryobacteraceae bacterium]|nr:response regulator transcription factor [Bryobacteraceae bacterium]